MDVHTPQATWSIRDAKSRLSEVLRRARKSGPQYIGKRDQCVVISREEWEAHTEPRQNLSTWLLQHSPGIEFTVPQRGESTPRTIPFSDIES